MDWMRLLNDFAALALFASGFAAGYGARLWQGQVHAERRAGSDARIRPRVGEPDSRKEEP